MLYPVERVDLAGWSEMTWKEVGNKSASVGFVSYRIVKGQGFYQPRRHRPLVGPYAVPKRIPVIAGNC